MHGAKEKETIELLRRIHACGIGAVCLESRPHPDFLGERWWHDLDIILAEAERLDMRIWIMDDRHYPTGMANDAAKDVPESLKRICLTEKHYDVKGPIRGDKLDILHWLNADLTDGSVHADYYCEKLEAVIIGRFVSEGDQESQDREKKLTDLQDVTGQVENGWLYLNLREGEYRVFVLTRKIHASKMLSDGISLLEPDSVKILIDEVYDQHDKHYAKYFGNTIAGFFSDEPGFFNLSDKGYGDTDRTGDTSVPLPWSNDVYALLRKEFGEKTNTMLPFLFGVTGEKGVEKRIRVKYMEIVAEKYEKNFTDQIGAWCRLRNVEHIGHMVEDHPGYERLGQSAAHYFKAIRGQDMAGIDVVLGDLLPDLDEGKGMFYHYGLPQLAASLANQSEHQRGRAVCELFGAYGWSEGITLMKWMADFMLVNGVNEFVPHAFTEAPFPDQDCPPHFWAGGNHPQYPYMKNLFSYMNRMAHLLSGGIPLIETAILFEAESDWAGETEPYFELGKILLTHQVGYHLVCVDDLYKAYVKDKKLCIGNMAYSQLYIGNLSYMDERTTKMLGNLSRRGIDIYFVGNRRPTSYDGRMLRDLETIPIITKTEAVHKAKQFAGSRVMLAEWEEKDLSVKKWLRIYSYRQGEQVVHMLMNTSGRQTVHADIRLKLHDAETEEGRFLEYDVMNQNCFRLPFYHDEKGEIIIHVELQPFESRVYLENYDAADIELKEKTIGQETISAYWGDYHIFLASYRDMNQWQDCGYAEKLFDIARKFPGFAGKIRYEIPVTEEGYRKIRLSGAGEAIEVFLNGESLGVRIAPPYGDGLPSYDKTCNNITKKSKNVVRIEIATTLVNAVPDIQSCKRPVPPTGFIGEILFIK